MATLEDAVAAIGADAFGAVAFVPHEKYAGYNQQGAWEPQAEAQAEVASLEWQLQ